MIDPELKEQLELIRHEMKNLRDRTNLWGKFVSGIVYGFGYVVGAVVVIAIIGWILNVVGVIPAFTSMIASFKHALNAINNSSSLR